MASVFKDKLKSRKAPQEAEGVNWRSLVPSWARMYSPESKTKSIKTLIGEQFVNDMQQGVGAKVEVNIQPDDRIYVKVTPVHQFQTNSALPKNSQYDIVEQYFVYPNRELLVPIKIGKHRAMVKIDLEIENGHFKTVNMRFFQNAELMPKGIDRGLAEVNAASVMLSINPLFPDLKYEPPTELLSKLEQVEGYHDNLQGIGMLWTLGQITRTMYYMPDHISNDTYGGDIVGESLEKRHLQNWQAGQNDLICYSLRNYLIKACYQINQLFMDRAKIKSLPLAQLVLLKYINNVINDEAKFQALIYGSIRYEDDLKALSPEPESVLIKPISYNNKILTRSTIDDFIKNVLIYAQKLLYSPELPGSAFTLKSHFQPPEQLESDSKEILEQRAEKLQDYVRELRKEKGLSIDQKDTQKTEIISKKIERIYKILDQTYEKIGYDVINLRICGEDAERRFTELLREAYQDNNSGIGVQNPDEFDYELQGKPEKYYLTWVSNYVTVEKTTMRRIGWDKKDPKNWQKVTRRITTDKAMPDIDKKVYPRIFRKIEKNKIRCIAYNPEKIEVVIPSWKVSENDKDKKKPLSKLIIAVREMYPALAKRPFKLVLSINGTVMHPLEMNELTDI
ncbi:MAG: hypothetical protein OHK0017_00670 [Patescibacteria group bacterium]